MKFSPLPFTQEEIKKRGLIWDAIGLPYNPTHIKRAKTLRKAMTPAENKLRYQFLRKHTQKFYRQRAIDHFIADFYCEKYALVIELDGESHNSPQAQEYDRYRTEILQIYNLTVLRFTNTEVYENFEGVCNTIDEYIANFETY